MSNITRQELENQSEFCKLHIGVITAVTVFDDDITARIIVVDPSVAVKIIEENVVLDYELAQDHAPVEQPAEPQVKPE